MDTQNGIFGLLDEIGKRRHVAVRDDQYEFMDILEAARKAGASGARFDFIDTGRFGSSELEWLAEAGAHYFTSDDVRADVAELLLVLKACRRGKTSAALFQRGPFEDGERSEALAFFSLRELVRKGFVVHVSNRERPRDIHKLIDLAEEAHPDAGFLVYHHHGSPVPELAELAIRGCRIHLSDRTFREEDMSVMDLILEDADRRASNIILHVERGLAEVFLRKWQNEGAVLFFKTPPSEPDSLLGAVERRAGRKILDPRVYYLHAAFLL